MLKVGFHLRRVESRRHKFFTEFVSLTHGLLNFYCIGCIASNEVRLTVNDEVGKIWEDAVIASLNVLTQHLEELL